MPRMNAPTWDPVGATIFRRPTQRPETLRFVSIPCTWETSYDGIGIPIQNARSIDRLPLPASASFDDFHAAFKANAMELERKFHEARTSRSSRRPARIVDTCQSKFLAHYTIDRVSGMESWPSIPVHAANWEVVLEKLATEGGWVLVCEYACTAGLRGVVEPALALCTIERSRRIDELTGEMVAAGKCERDGSRDPGVLAWIGEMLQKINVMSFF